MNAKTIVLSPRLSEKTYGLAQTKNVYVFEVPAGVNKHDVARAVSAQYEVTVIDVNLTNIPGKVKRTFSKSGRTTTGKRATVRKAYVALKKGDSLPVFAAIEEAEAKEADTQEKVAKATEKVAKKSESRESEKPAHHGIHLPGRRSGGRGGDK